MIPRLVQTLRRPPVISASLFGVMLALRAWLQWVGPLPGDRYALAHYSASHLGLPSQIVNSYVAVASPWTVFVTLLAGVWALWRYVGIRVAAGLILAEFVIVWNAALKTIFGQTPLWAQAHHPGVNYPSGHASYVTAVFGYLAWVGIRRREPVLISVCLLIILGMGPERVLSATHLVSDVIGGYLLGLAWLVLVATWAGLATPAHATKRPCA